MAGWSSGGRSAQPRSLNLRFSALLPKSGQAAFGPFRIVVCSRARWKSEGVYARETVIGMVSQPIVAWQTAVHVPCIHDLELDISTRSPEESAARIEAIRGTGPQHPTARERILAARDTSGTSAVEKTGIVLERHGRVVAAMSSAGWFPADLLQGDEPAEPTQPAGWFPILDRGSLRPQG